MASRRKEDVVPLFTDSDQRYFAAILKEAIDKYGDEDREILRDFIKAGIKRRFGNKENNGLLHSDLIHEKPETVSLLLKAGKKVREIYVSSAPFDATELIERIDNLGWDWQKPKFGISIGNMSTPEFKKMVDNMVSFLLDEEIPSTAKFNYNVPDDSLRKQATIDSLQKAEKREVLGVKKKVKTTEKYAQRSRAKIPFDCYDEAFLSDVSEKMRNIGVSETDIITICKIAFGIRYSNHFVTQGGTFQNTDDNGITGTLTIPYRNDFYTITVEVNLPQLVEKFAEYRYARDFIGDPLFDPMMTSSQRRIAINAADRWIKHKEYTPQQCSTEELRDSDFFNLFAQDYEKWITGKLSVDVPDSANLCGKLLWRNNNRDMIVSSPNVADRYNRDEDKFPTLLALFLDEARRCVNALINFLDSKYSSLRFKQWAMDENNISDFIQHAITVITVNKTGVNPELYRMESNRFKWMSNGVKKIIEESYGAYLATENMFNDESMFEHVVDEDVDKRHDFTGGKFSSSSESDKLTAEIEQKFKLTEEEIEQISQEIKEMSETQSEVLTPPAEYLRPDGRPTIAWLRLSREEKTRILQESK